ncbi:hypothetical protein [Enterobacter hormaechei]|uniref:hypothetical protein n=1 Tax=Enterobacter hormaechei TaxID=158836 RepID=UPI0039679624
MITFTKEQLIASAHARIEFAEMMLAGELEPLKERTWSIELELARIALASLEAEPVAYIRSAHNPDGFCFADGIHPTHRHQRLPLSTLQDGCYWKVTPLYTATPAPVSMKDHQIREMVNELRDIAIEYQGTQQLRERIARTVRAAMLQGAEPVTTDYKLPFDQWLSQQTGTIDVECGCVMTEVFFHWLRVAYEAGKSPVIPDGWVLVPEEPTHEMLEAGDEQFGTYDVYRRMVAASPQQK